MAFELTREEIKSGIGPVLQSFLGQEDYADMSLATRALVDRGFTHALYVPAVRYIVDATLSMLTQPSVEPRLPREVIDRAHIAAHFAQQATNVAVRMQAFAYFYGKNPNFNDLTISKGDLKALMTSDYLETLGAAPFFDVATLGGGVVRAMRERAQGSDITSAIVAGKGLLMMAGFYKGFTREVHAFLGMPYAEARHFEIGEGTVPDINFSSATKAVLKQYVVPDRGCPAAMLPSAESGHSLLHEYWSKLVHYLIPEDATANLGPETASTPD